jgi:hypothetical protein
MTNDPFAQYRDKTTNLEERKIIPSNENKISEESQDPFYKYRDKPPEVPDENLGLWGAFQQGREKSVIGRAKAITSGDIKKQFKEDLPFWQQVAEAAGETGNDLPVMIAGGFLGGAAGTPLGPIGTAAGAGAGGFGLPSLLKSTMNEYIDFQNKGGDLTFEDFIKRAENVGTETGKSLALGASMGIFNKMLPFIEKIPGLKQLFKTKYIGKPAEIATKGVAETSALTGGQAGLEGRAPTKEDFAKNAILLAGMKTANKGIDIAKNPGQLFPESAESRAANLQKRFENVPPGGPPPPPPPPPGGIPQHGYENSKSILQQLIAEDRKVSEAEQMSAVEKANAGQPREIRPQGQIGQGQPLQGRVTPGGRAFNLAVRTTPRQEVTPQGELSQNIGRVITPVKYNSKTEAGIAGKAIIGDTYDMVLRGVNDLYNESRAAMAEIPPTQFRDLDNRLQELAARIEETPPASRSSPQNQMLASLYDQRAKLGTYRRVTHEDGTVTTELEHYNDIAPQSLVQDVQNIRGKVDNDFAHGNPKNVFLPYLEILQDAIENAARHAGNHEAVDLWSEARNGHRVMSQTFRNNDINPWLRSSNRNYIKTFEKDLNIDKFNILKPILDLTPEGQAFQNANRRVIVEQSLNNIIENPHKFTPRQINEAIAELSPIITPEQSQQIASQIEQRRQAPPFEAKKAKEAKAKPGMEKPAREKSKYESMKPEDIQNDIKSITGLRELRDRLEKTPEGKRKFDTAIRLRARSYLTKGKIGKNSTGRELADVLRNEDTHEWFSEAYGEDVVNDTIKVAEEIGKKELTKEVREEALLKYTKKAHTVSLLLTLKGIAGF